MIFYDKEFLGKKFREYRKKAKYTQEELSEKIGIAEKHYGKLERGVFYPSIETFFKLIYTLNIPMSEFGISIKDKRNNVKRDKLVKEIYSSDENEIELYADLINSIKKYNKKD